MTTIVIACAISLALVMSASIALGWSLGGAEIWIITLVVLLVTVGVRRMLWQRRESGKK